MYADINLVEIVRAKAEDALEEKANAIYQEMIRQVPVDTGNLRDHIKVVKSAEWEYFIGTDDVEYAKFANNGRGPVVPKRKPYLKFEIDGEVIRTKYAKGYTGRKYVQKTASKFR